MQILCPLRICHCHDTDHDTETDKPSIQGASQRCPIVAALASHDLRAVTAAFSKALPSLRCLTLELVHNMEDIVRRECYGWVKEGA